MKITKISNKLLAICMFAILVFGQMAISVHSAVHIDSEITNSAYTSDDHNSNHDDKDLKHQCPECLLTQAFQFAILTDVFYVSERACFKCTFITRWHSNTSLNLHSYQARGPPLLLI